MKAYKSHKTVRAAKIIVFTAVTGVAGAILTLQGDQTETRVSVDNAWLDKHAPKWGTPEAEVELVGGYLVEYADGYRSWSPPEPFEAGYTEVGAAPVQSFQGLPVAGYRPQSAIAVDCVNAMKSREELILQQLDHMSKDPEVDQRWLAIGRTQLEQAFMAIHRSIFRPARVTFTAEG